VNSVVRAKIVRGFAVVAVSPVLVVVLNVRTIRR